MKVKLQIALKQISILLAIAILAPSCKTNTDIDPHSIQMGEFRASIVESGELQAEKAYTVITPDVRKFGGRTMRIIELVENGKRIKEGDLIVRFDPSSVLNFIEEQQTRLEVQAANLNKLIVTQESNRKALNADLQSAMANFDMKKLELEKFQFESETKKQVKKLEFEQAEIRLNNLKEKIKLQNNIMQNDLKIQKIRVIEHENRIVKAKEALGKLEMYSTQKGIAQLGTLRNNGTRQMLRVGDEVWRGRPLVKIPDIDKMKVTTQIHENDISKIKTGQKVIIRLDAYPKVPFEGVVETIGKLSYEKDRNSNVKVFDVQILIKESDPVLKPGMTVSCEIVYTDMKEAYYVSNECIDKNGSGYYIYKKQGAGYEQQRINVGPSNSTYTVILGTFNPGTDLIPVSELNDQTKI